MGSRAGVVKVAPEAVVAAATPLAAAPYLVRAPAHDSASIEHHRLGGNFAYSTAEAPAPVAPRQPAPIVQTHHVAQPIFKDVPIHQTFPVTGPVRTHQTVHQP